MSIGGHGLFVLDLDRCTGCAACVVACNTENAVGEGLSWRRIHTFNARRLVTAPVYHFSLACNHCLDPACRAGCPADAYRKDLATGAVLVDQDRCIGCRYCTWVCPYEAPRFNATTGLIEKCTFCEHRLSEDRVPACVTACPTDALRFARDDDPGAVDRRGFPDTGLRPALRIEGSRRSRAPVLTAAPVAAKVTRAPDAIGWGGMRNEWSLWFFTSAAIFLVAWFTAGSALEAVIPLPIFAVVGILAMAVSALHLGRISRIWRAVINLKSSWVSREVVLFSTFFAAACAVLLRPDLPQGARWPIAAVGLAAMYAMDMVYRVPGQPVATVPHSAMATLTAAFYIAVLLANPVLVLPVAALKLVLYLARRRRPFPGGTLLPAVRVGVGLLPAFALALTSSVSIPVTMFGAVVGELIDRAEFYAGLRFLTPQHQIDTDLAANSYRAERPPASGDPSARFVRSG